MMTFDMARKCKREGRKTVSTEDLFQSLQYLGKHLPDNAAKNGPMQKSFILVVLFVMKSTYVD